MPFTPGWHPDKQSRVAREASNQGTLDGPLPLISSGGAPSVVEFDWSNPSFAARDRQARIAVLAGQSDQVQGFTAGTMPAAASASLPPGAQLYDLPARAASRAQAAAYTQADASEFWMLADSVNPGEQSTDLPPRAAARARDYSIAASFPLELIGQDAMVAGRGSVDLAPRGASRLADYTIALSLPINLLIPVGAQSTDLPPRAAQRARDYSLAASFPLELIGQDAVNPGAQITDVLPPRAAARARDYSLTGSFPLELIGQDSLPVGEQLSGNAPAGPLRATSLVEPGVNNTVVVTSVAPVIPCGQSTIATDVPRGSLRARDYSVATAFPLELIGQDATLVGEQLSGPAPAGALRARDYSIAASFPLTLVGQDAQLVGKQSVDLPPRAALRANDYSLTAGFPLELIGADVVNPGQQLSGNGPAGARRASQLTETGVNLTLIISQAPPTIPCGQSTAGPELPTLAAARARDYSVAASFPLELIGKDRLFGAAGQTVAFDWPNPRGPQRLRDYGWVQPYMPVVPMGQTSGATELAPHAALRTYALYDPGTNATILLPVATVPLPPGIQSTDLAPRAPLRSKEYCQASWFPLELIGKDNLPPGRSSIVSEGPPRGPLRAKDYTYLSPLSLELYGQDVMYGRPGEVPTYDWQLPTPAAARMRDYSITQTPFRGSGIPPRDLVYIVTPPEAKWAVHTILLPKFASGPPQQ